MRAPSRLAALAAASGLIAAAAASAAPANRQAASNSYEFFYTTTSRTGADVWRASFITAGPIVRLTAPVALATVPHAKGILGLPNGQLLIGAPGHRVYSVDARTGAVRRLGSMQTQRVLLQPNGQFAARPGRTASATPSAGVFDRYTGDLISGRGGIVAATSPRTGAMVSSLNVAYAIGHKPKCDQTSTDDRGDLILACRQLVVLIRLSSPRQLDAIGTSVSVGRLPAPASQISPSFLSDHPAVAGRCRRHCTHPVFTG